MSTAELNTLKTELACKILDETDLNIVSQLSMFFVKAKTPTTIKKIQGMPYTDEERRMDIEQALNDYNNNRTITHDEFVKQHASWW